jgi:uncharacterized glyoxalase superfamily protein PhnB
MASDEAQNLPSIFPSLYYDDAMAAIAWLETAFGFTRRLVVPGPDGTVAHSELTYGSGVIMVGSSRPEMGWVSPRRLSALNQALSVRVDDPDEHYKRAKAAGAEILRELKDEEHGSRGYMAKDIEGHHWYFGTYQPGAHW